MKARQAGMRIGAPQQRAAGFPGLSIPAGALLLLGAGPVAGESEYRELSHPESGASASRAAALPRPDPERLREYVAYYETSLGNGQYLEAETAAKQMIEYAIRTGGIDGVSMADALSRLAFAQRGSKQYESALQNYGAAIRLLERSENRLSDKLIEPMLDLGHTYLENDRADLALRIFDRALYLKHANEGPHSLEQAGILDAIAAAQMANGDADAALATIDRMHYLHTREFGLDSEEILPVLEKRAELLDEIGLYREERLVRLQMVYLIEEHRGETDLSLLEPYTALGRTYLHEVDQVIFRSEPTAQTGETYLKKALAVAEQSPDANWLAREQALIELADYYTILDVQDKARRNYRAAWELASSDESYLERRKQDLERVVPLTRLKLDRYANFGYRSSDNAADRADYVDGYVQARFSVNERGRVTDIEIVAADPPGFTDMEIRVERALRNSIYRPRYEDGMPVKTSDQLFRHEFLYLESDGGPGIRDKEQAERIVSNEE